MVDSILPFVKATYLLEGDGPLALTVYQCLKELDAHIVAEHYPNIEAVASGFQMEMQPISSS